MMRQFFAQGVAAFWPLAAMLIFMAVFAGVVFRTFRKRKSDFDEVARLPLEDGEGASHV